MPPVRMRSALARRRFGASVRRRVRPQEFGAFGRGSVLHPPVAVDHRDRVTVGDATYVLAGATLLVGPRGRITIGSRTYLGRDLTICAGAAVEIGDDVMGSDRLLFVDHAPPGIEAAAPRPIRVGDGVFLGTGAMVMPGVRIGARAFIGAGAVVTHDIPPNAVAVGNPARVVRAYDEASRGWVSAGG